MTDIVELLNAQRQYFATGATRDVRFRIEQLRNLKEAIRRNESRILDALHRDLRKHEVEAYVTEVGFCLEEIKLAVRNLKKWARPRRQKTPWMFAPSKSRVVPEPYGLALIMGPWNYPFNLVIAPLVAAISAGNIATVKPSELAPNTSKMITALIAEAFNPEYISVVQGGVDISKRLLEEPFDYIFFTGGEAVGRIVMEKAAKHLTPVTLELGGKSPVIVDKDAPIESTAKRIAWGKFLNAGQTCLAPDYLLVQQNIKQPLVEALARQIDSFFGEIPSDSPDYARIINRTHIDRLAELTKSGRICAGGEIDAVNRYIAPTIIDSVTLDDPIMKEEIFGPLLPIIEFDTIDDAFTIVARFPKPLALYLFTPNKKTQRRVIRSTSSGAAVINDTVIHIANYNLPFGGVGASGMGAYHGKFGFDTFSHLKAVFARRSGLDLIFRYPPYKTPLKLFRKLQG